MKAYIILLASLLTIACGSDANSDQNTELGVEHNHDHSDHLPEMEVGIPPIDTIYTEISCVGVVDVPPQSRATVSAPLGGFLKAVNFYPGDRVNKGQVLARVSHPDYVEVQHEYLDAKAQLVFLNKDYDRKVKLFEENAINERALEEVQSSRDVQHARMMSAAAKLEQMGISLSGLDADHIQSELALRSPISGYITKIDVNLGQHVTPEQTLYEIVDDSHIHIELKVFPKDISKVETGQQIQYSIPGNATEFTGEVQQVGREVQSESGAFIVHAHPSGHESSLRPGQYIEGAILLNPMANYTLSPNAIVQIDGKPHVFEYYNDSYHAKLVNIVLNTGDRIQISDSLSNPIVLKDAYLLQEAESGHSH